MEYLLKQIAIGKKSRKHYQPHNDSLVIHIWLQHLLSQLSNKLVLVAHAYSSFMLKATQNFKISNDRQGFDIFQLLLTRDQLDNNPNLDVDVN